MSVTPKPDALRKPDPGKCLARSVAEALAEDPTLEAVTVDQAHQTISVATLGKTDVPKLTERISATVQQAQEAGAVEPCTLLAGETTCQTCGQPLSDFERQKITIRQEADTTTIARVTCPTAPKFWRWRDIPWPKVVQRDVEFLEHAEEVDEWKAELAAAILCGVFGLGAWFFRAHPLSVIGYVLAYLAGSWFTAQEVWERLQKRAIDVHFLMLAVAARQRQHRRLGRRHDVAVPLLPFRRAGTLCAGPHATGNPLALPRSPQIRHRARRTGP